MTERIFLGGREVCCLLERKAVRSVTVRVREDGVVHVCAPAFVPERTISELLSRRSASILRALDAAAERARRSPRPKAYVSGEALSVFGKLCTLRVTAAPRNDVRLSEDGVCLCVKDPTDTALKQKVLESWERELLKGVLEDVCKKLYPQFKEYGVAYPQIRLRKMRACWGTCQPKRGIVTFNASLVHVPLSCVEYVAAHELTHFLKQDHSREYYAFLTRFLPDWKARKRALDAYPCAG